MVEQKLQPTTELLKEVQLLKVFNENELADLVRAGTVQNYEAYSNVVIEGELSWGLYLILDGTVGIFKTNKMSGNNYDVGRIGKGGFFGEMSLVDENPRSATVRALTDSTLYFISKEAFEQFLSRSSDRKVRFLEACLKNIVGRLRELDDNYVISQYQLWKTALSKEKEVA